MPTPCLISTKAWPASLSASNRFSAANQNNVVIVDIRAGLGLEILKKEWLTIDLEGRGAVLFGSKAGGHVGVEPSLGVSVAF